MSTPHRHGPVESHPARRSRLLARALSADVLIVAGLLGLLGLTTVTAPRWSRYLRQPVPSGDEDFHVSETAPTPVPDARRTIQVKLFFEASDGSGLVIEERTVPFSSDLARQVELVVEALLAGPEGELTAPLPSGVGVRGAFVTRAGVAYVDLTSEVHSVLSGSHAELLSVYALVNSVTANLPAVKRVQLLVDGRSAETLAGHVDLGRPLGPDMSLLAVMDLVAPPPSGAPAPAPPGAGLPPPPPGGGAPAPRTSAP